MCTTPLNFLFWVETFSIDLTTFRSTTMNAVDGHLAEQHISGCSWPNSSIQSTARSSIDPCRSLWRVTAHKTPSIQGTSRIHWVTRVAMILSDKFALVIEKMGTKIIVEIIPTWYHLWEGTRRNDQIRPTRIRLRMFTATSQYTTASHSLTQSQLSKHPTRSASLLNKPVISNSRT